MELFSLVSRPYLNRVIRSKRLVIDRPPPIVFNSFVPALRVTIISFIISHIDLVLSLVPLYLHVISRGKGIDVDDATVRENLVVDEWGKFLTTESEP